MSEAGGPVFEGSSARPETAKPRLVDRVRERVKNRLSQNTGEIVEAKWMNAYQKTVDATTPGLRKKALELVRPAAWAIAKVNRIATAVIDPILGVGGAFGVVGSIIDIANPQKAIKYADEILSQNGPDYQRGSAFFDKARDARIDRAVITSHKTKGQVRMSGILSAGGGVLSVALSKARISRVASGWMADIAGAGGEKIAQITNKILRGKPKAAAA